MQLCLRPQNVRIIFFSPNNLAWSRFSIESDSYHIFAIVKVVNFTKSLLQVFYFLFFAILFHKSNPIKNANGLIHHLEDWTIFTNFLWYINNTTYRANIPFRKLLYSLVSNLSQSPEICMSEPAFWFFWQKGSSCNDGIRTPVACVTSHCLNHYTNGSSYLIECRELIINDARDVSRRRVTFWRVNHLWLRTNSTCCNGTLFLTSP